MVVVALVGRELYESSKTNKLECPVCTHQIHTSNATETENVRCWDDEFSDDDKMFGYEYFFKLKVGQPCCSLIMYRYQNPLIIWVWCFLAFGVPLQLQFIVHRKI